MGVQKHNLSAVDLFWTGGWDSTFRLLDLLLEKKISVKPHYIIDDRRASHDFEMDAMRAIRDHLIKKYPFVKKRLHPVKFSTRQQIIPNNKTGAAFNAIRELRHLGDQYLWLSEYCIQNNLNGVEIAIERSLIHDFNDDITHYLLEGYQNGNAHQKDLFRALKPHFDILFQPFSFPIRHLSKPDMLQIAQQRGWMNLLNRTWFCFRPKNFNQPCGHCKPCLRAIQENFAWRIPIHRIYLGKMKLIYSHWRNKKLQETPK